MDGILIINKERGYTSRDIVNIVGKELNTKKIGHTGTLDPMASGVLVLCIGNGLKMVELMTNHVKEYSVEFILGMETDTLDLEGNVLYTSDKYIDDDTINKNVMSFKKSYLQEVPKYSAVKVRGRKLYEYAREGVNIELPKRMVNIIDINNVSVKRVNDTCYVSFNCIVSKGTYIRSLIRDIAYQLGTYGVMSSLVRTKVDNFTLSDACSLEDIKNNNYHIIGILDAFLDIKKIYMDDELLFKVKNGCAINKFIGYDMAFMLDKNGTLVALYKNKDNMARMYKYFL